MLDRLIAAALLTLAGVANAAESCAVPPNLTPAPAGAQEEQRILPVEKFVIAWYWWPQNCRNYPGEGCSQKFAFKVHGLWPDGAGKTYPQFCRAPTALSPATVRANWCMTPAVSLLQHEWAKHGTCAWPDEKAFFADEQRVAAGIVMPDVSVLRGKLTAGSIRDAILKANPGLPRGSIFVGTDRKQWLTETRVCLTKAYAPMACEDNDIGAPDRVPVRVWPR